MKKLAMLSSVVALCVITATAAWAQTDTRNNMNQNSRTTTDVNTTVTGKVVSTSGSTFVIETDAGNRMTFDTNEMQLPSDASVGTRVQVAYVANPMGNGNRLTTVTVMPTRDTAIAGSRYPPTGNGNDTTNTENSDMYAANRNLPKTASLMPLLGLLGVISLATGLVIRIIRS